MKIDFRYIREMTMSFSVTNVFAILLMRLVFGIQFSFVEMLIVTLFADLMGMFVSRKPDAA